MMEGLGKPLKKNARKKLEMSMETAMPCSLRTTKRPHQAAGDRQGNQRIQQNPKGGEQFIFPIVDGTAKFSVRDHGIRKSTVARDVTL